MDLKHELLMVIVQVASAGVDEDMVLLVWAGGLLLADQNQTHWAPFSPPPLCQWPKERRVAVSSPKAALPLKMCISAGILCLPKKKKKKKTTQNPKKQQKRELKKKTTFFPILLFWYESVCRFPKKSLCQGVVSQRIAKPSEIDKTRNDEFWYNIPCRMVTFLWQPSS